MGWGPLRISPLFKNGRCKFGMGKKQRDKGARGERWLRDQIRSFGWTAERGAQRHGGPDSPDVRTFDLPIPMHWEMKKGYERLSVPRVLEKCSSETPEGATACGVWKQDYKPAIAFLYLDDLLRILSRLGDHDEAE